MARDCCMHAVASCQSNCGAKLLVDATTRKRCFCDYYCNAYNGARNALVAVRGAVVVAPCTFVLTPAFGCRVLADCCGSTQSKDAACPSLRPTANMTLLQSCRSTSAHVLLCDAS